MPVVENKDLDKVDMGYYNNRPSKDLCWQFLQTFCGLTLTMLIVALGYFSFGSPDPHTCYFMPGFDAPATRKDDLLKLA